MGLGAGSGVGDGPEDVDGSEGGVGGMITQTFEP